MITTLIFLAQQGGKVPPSEMTPETKDALIVLGVLFVVVLIAAFFILVLSQRRYSHRHHHSSRPANRAQPDAATGQGRAHRHHHRHHRHHEEYSTRNPTLAETGGLPPRREQNSTIPAPLPTPPPQA